VVEPYPDFARLLNHWLTLHDRSINWLARKLKCNPSTVSRWLTQATRPASPQDVQAILDALAIHAPQDRQALLVAAGYAEPQPPLLPTADAGVHANGAPLPTVVPHDFVAYDQRWVGRDGLVQELSAQLQNGRRLLVVVGMAGIGKTALAERLSLTLTPWLQLDLYPITRLNFDHQALNTDFASVAFKWLTDWGENVSPEDQRSPTLLLRKVMQALARERRLLVIDALEKILTGGEEGQSALTDDGWRHFFHSILAAESLQGRVVVTTQDLPGQLAAVGAEYPNRWRHIALRGLTESEQMALFQKHGLAAQPTGDAAHLLARIGRIYGGHPLALRAIAGEIAQDYGSNVLAYWQDFGEEIKTVERDLAAAQQTTSRLATEDNWRLDRFSVELQRQVRHRLDGAFDRLRLHAPDAYAMLCGATAHRSPRPLRFWIGLLAAMDKSVAQQEAAFQALRDRALVEEIVDPKGGKLFALHNLICSLALEHRLLLWPTPESEEA